MEQSHTEAYPPLTEEQRDAIRDGMRRRAERGEVNGASPLGYANVAFASRKYAEVDEKIAPLIREAFRLAAEPGCSLRMVLKEVTAKGLTSRRGKPLGVSSLHAILTNPFYCGMLRLRDERAMGSHQPLVSMALFNQVQRRLAGRAKR